MASELDGEVELSNDSQAGPEQRLHEESAEGKPGLIAKQKEQADYLKAGGASGVSKEFGKPVLLCQDSSGAEPIIPAKPRPVAAPVDTTKDARDLHEATSDVGTDEEKVFYALKGKTPGEMAELKKVFKASYGVELEDVLANELSETDFKKAQELMYSKDVPTAESSEAQARLREIQNDPKVVEKKEELKRQLERSKASPEAIQRAQADMAALEKRAAESQPPLTADKIAGTYAEISRMLKHTGHTPTTAVERAELATEVLRQAADPSCVDQGFNATCQVASLESRTYRSHPEAVSKLIADMATKGKFITADGVEVKINYKAMHTSAETEWRTKGHEPLRSYASQIFQVTAVNTKFAVEHAKGASPKRYVYEDDPPISQNPLDTGERLYVFDRYTGQPLKVTKNTTFVGAHDLPEINYQITGKREEAVVIQHNDYKNATNQGTFELTRPEDLRNALTAAKGTGKLPLILQVHTGNEPFLSDSTGGAAPGSGGWHTVVVTDYNPQTGEAYFDNTWGKGLDHNQGRPVSWEQLYKATKPPEA